MRFEGIHHITCITADAPGNVDFYVRVLGLRLVKKSVNQDDPTVYHLFYADEKGSAGSDLTFFEYPHARRGRAGAGMVHRIVFRVASDEALDFWEERLAAEDIPTQRADTGLRFEDAEGLGFEIAVIQTDDEPLIADNPQIPRELALQGFDSVRAYADPDRSRRFLEAPIIDRFYFKSVYFREPSGVLFEIATIGPGFTVDEPLESLGERLSLPPDYEHLRAKVEPLLTPLPNPRELVQR